MEYSRSKQFKSIKLCTLLSSMTKSQTILLPGRLWIIFVQCIPAIPTINLFLAILVVRLAAVVSPVLVFKWPLHGNTMYQCLCHSPHFISSQRHYIISHHHKKKGEYSTVRYSVRDIIHITFLLCIVWLPYFIINCCYSLTVPIN